MKQSYPLLDFNGIRREDIVLIPESELSALDRAELTQLRRGSAEYDLVFVDTPENRERVRLRTSYFQMVAYNEGWRFDPSNYRVRFVPKREIIPIVEKDRMIRIYKGESTTGFDVDLKDGSAKRMKVNEAEGLAKRIIRSFFRIK